MSGWLTRLMARSVHEEPEGFEVYDLPLADLIALMQETQARGYLTHVREGDTIQWRCWHPGCAFRWEATANRAFDVDMGVPPSVVVEHFVRARHGIEVTPN